MYKISIICAVILNVFFLSRVVAVTTPNVNPVPDSTNTYSEYTITSNLSNGASAAIQANVDSILIRFNSSTGVPATINPSYISVNNTSANVVTVSGQVIKILSPVNIPRSWPFTVVIDAAAKIQNPSVAGDYTLEVKTTTPPDGSWVTSNAYTIAQSNTKVTPAAVSPNPSVVSESASYTISFNTGNAGSLTAGESTISIAFPAETTVPSGSLAGVTVNGTAAAATAGTDTVVITTPVNVENNGAVSVVFAIGSGLVNPSIDSSYTLSVATSSETTYVTSDPYTISPADQLSISSITSKPDTVNQGGEFAFDFRTGSSGALTANSDTIYVIFPQNTYLPQDMSRFNVSISSGGFSDNAADLLVSKANTADDDTAAVVTPINIGNSTDVSLSFGAASGYLNPSIAGNYTIKLKTSREQSAVESNPYSITNTETQVSNANVTPGSNATSTATDYTIDFNLGRLGRLVPGQSTITLTFDSDYTLSTNLSDYDLSTITVAEGAAVSLSGNITVNSTDNYIQVTVPAAVETQNSDNIVVYLGGSTTQPITNPATTANYTLGVKTSVEPINVNSNTYNIGGGSITINNVTLSNSAVNNVSQYTFNITTGIALQNRNGQTPDDYLTIIFPEGTVLPGTISASDVLIAGSVAQSVQVNQSTRTVTVVVNTSVPAGTFDVVFQTGANIINPVVPSATYYKVTISTIWEPAPVTSSAYAITGDNTQTSSVSMTANPSVVNALNAVYTLSFTTSSTGKITGGTPAGSSTITVDFDTATIVPATISASTIEINATPCQDISIVSSGAGGIVTLTIPNGLTIDSSSVATVKFTEGAGLDNGSTAGTYKVRVKTSSDTVYSGIAGTEGDYTISASQSLEVTSVLPSPSTQNASAGYSIKFNVGSPGGALSVGDSIILIFPSNTYLPSTVSTSDVTVNGTSPTVNPTVSGDTLFIVTPVNVSDAQEVTVLLNQIMGILNPTLVQNYTLEVGTSSEPGPYTSPAYSITQTTTTVSAADVSITTPTPGTASPYTITFNVGANGRLLAGTSTISITFGSETGVSTAVPADYTNSSISVNGGTAVNIASNIAVSSQTVTITVPSSVNISNDDQVSIVLTDDTTDPITNPSTEGSYQLQVRTSIEITDINSNAYTISNVGPVSAISATLGSSTVNDNSSYSISFTVDNTAGALSVANGDQINITFPSNTFIPASITPSDIQVNSVAATQVSTNPSLLQITIDTPTDIANGSTVTVDISANAGLENPSIYGDYTLNVNTTSQPVDGTSTAYTLQATTTTIINLEITVTPNTPSVAGRYEYSFVTGSLGRLVSGTSLIYLLFPYDISFTLGTPAASKVTVNSTAAPSVELRENSGIDPDTLVVTVPSTVTIGNNSSVTVLVDESAGIQNASTTDPLPYQAYTSVEYSPVQKDYSLPVELTSFNVESTVGTVVLKWRTESELENAYWFIQKKELSEKEFQQINKGELKISGTANTFEKIARIDGQGNKSSGSDYVYADSSVEAGHFYAYRLADVSYKGQTTYHDAVYVQVKAPTVFHLAQNYPNPFNPVTTIVFDIAKEAQVSLTIYDILGRKIAELVSHKKYKTGRYKVKWDGRNIAGARVASGIYFYRLEAGDYIKIRKMILMK